MINVTSGYWDLIERMQAKDKQALDQFGTSIAIDQDYLVIGAPGEDIKSRTTWDFEMGDLDILLINIYNYGSGMNLQCATDIVMFHKFDKNIEKQVIGRGQRFGRKGSLNIHYLLNKNEISII